MIARLRLFAKRHLRRAGRWLRLSTSGILSDQKSMGYTHLKRKMRKHFDLRIGTGSFFWKRKKQNIADEAALGGFYVVRTNVPGERMSAPTSS